MKTLVQGHLVQTSLLTVVNNNNNNNNNDNDNDNDNNNNNNNNDDLLQSIQQSD